MSEVKDIKEVRKEAIKQLREITELSKDEIKNGDEITAILDKFDLASLIVALDYIEELEKKIKEIEFDLISVYMSGFYDGEKKYKDKIRDKIKELEKLNFNNYANEYDNGNEVKYYILKEFKEIIGE